MTQLPALLAQALADHTLALAQMVTIEHQGTTYYFPSHDSVTTPDADNTFYQAVSEKGFLAKSQKLSGVSGIGEIGAAQLNLVDNQINAWLRSIDQAGQSLKGATMRLFLCLQDAAFDSDHSVQLATHYVTSTSFNELEVNIKANDAQRFLKDTKVFQDLRVCNLTQTLGINDDVLHVSSTLGFETVAHSSDGYTDGTDGQTVGYLVLTAEDDAGNQYKEHIAYTGKTANSFTGLKRGLHGTNRYEFAGPKDGETGIEVKELAYLEGAPMKMLWALLTGELYGQSGASLPSHWHAGVDTDYLDLASFENIGADLWSTSQVIRGEFLKSESAKSFIENELLSLFSLQLRITPQGQLALHRAVPVLSTAPAVVELNESNLAQASDINTLTIEIRNFFVVKYGYDAVDDKFKRNYALLDAESKARYGEGIEQELSYKFLHHTKPGAPLLRQIVQRQADRFANEPLETKVIALVNEQTASLEVGDVVRLNLADMPDFTAAANFNRAMQITQIKHDIFNGHIEMTLRGSSRRSSTIVQAAQNGAEIIKPFPAIDRTNMVSLKSVLSSSDYTESNGTLTITANVHLSGATNLANASGQLYGYYYDGDVVIDGAATVTYDKNLVVECNNYANHGDLDGAGRASTGAVGVGLNYTSMPTGATNSLFYEAKSGIAHAPYYRQAYRAQHRVGYQAPVRGDDSLHAQFVASVNDQGRVLGLPDGLCGVSGVTAPDSIHVEQTWPDVSSGDNSTTNTSTLSSGGVGGAGGAGFLLVCTGMDDGNGSIKTSGSNGGTGSAYSKLVSRVTTASDGSSYPEAFNTQGTLFSGNGGGGAPGAFKCLIKNNGQQINVPNLLAADRVICQRGATTTNFATSDPIKNWQSEQSIAPDEQTSPPTAANPSNWIPSFTDFDHSYYFGISTWGGPNVDIRRAALPPLLAASSYTADDYRAELATVQVLANPVTEADAPKVQVIEAMTVNVVQTVVADAQPYGSMKTIEATVSCSDDNFAAAQVALRKLDAQDQPINSNYSYLTAKTNTKYSIDLAADGSKYELTAWPVSSDGVKGEAVTQTVTVANAVSYPVAPTSLSANSQIDHTADQSTCTVTTTASFGYAVHDVDLQWSFDNANWQSISAQSKRVANDFTFTFAMAATAQNLYLRAFAVSDKGVKSQTAANTTLLLDAPDLTLPPITGLKLDQGALANQFDGREANFTWLKMSNTAEDDFLADVDSVAYVDKHLRHYRVRVLVSGKIVREETTLTESWSYTDDKLAEDGNPRSFTVQVVGISTDSQESTPASLAVSNPAPAAVTQVAVTTSYYSMAINFVNPSDRDFVGVNLYVATGASDPYAATPKFYSANSIKLSGLAQNTQYSIGIESVDKFGKGSRTTSITATTKELIAADVNGLGDWATKIDQVDKDWIASRLASGAIVSDKIEGLTAAKILAGEISATVSIGSLGTVQTNNSGYQAIMGLVSRPAVSATDLVFHTWDGSASSFWVDASGRFKAGNASNYVHWNGSTLNIQGNVTITGGSGYAALSDAPSNLAELDAAQNSKLAGIEAGANNVTNTNQLTDGANLGSTANWSNVTSRPNSLGDLDSSANSKLAGIEAGANNVTNTNQLTDGAGLGNTAVWSGLANIPQRFRDNPLDGLNLTASYMGYYNTASAEWTSHINASGLMFSKNFHFGGASDNYLDYSGGKLVVRTDNFELDSVGNVAIKGNATIKSHTTSDLLVSLPSYSDPNVNFEHKAALIINASDDRSFTAYCDPHTQGQADQSTIPRWIDFHTLDNLSSSITSQGEWPDLGVGSLQALRVGQQQVTYVDSSDNEFFAEYFQSIVPTASSVQMLSYMRMPQTGLMYGGWKFNKQGDFELMFRANGAGGNDPDFRFSPLFKRADFAVKPPSDDSTGYGQIGTTSAPWKKGYFADIYRTNEYTLSDLSTKKDVQSLTDEIARKVLELSVKTYQYKDNDAQQHYGLIAQELELSFPDLVSTNEQGLKQIKSDAIPFLTLHALTYIARKIGV